MISIDKNEVDISKLFNWGKEFTIYSELGDAVFSLYMRVIGDADLNRARVYALRKSAELRKKLRTRDSEERTAFIPDLENISLENLIEMVLFYSTKSLAGEVIKTINLHLPKEPDSDAPLEEHEKYQLAVDSWGETRTNLIEDELKKRLEKERIRLSTSSKEDLMASYEKLLTDELCEEEMYKAFNDMKIFFTVFSDAGYKNKLFKNLEEFLNLPTLIKEQLSAFYESLDIKIEELKK